MSPLQASSGWSSSEEAGNNTHGAVAAEDDVDTGAALVAGISGDLDPAEAARVRRKIDFGILPMMCTLYWWVLLGIDTEDIDVCLPRIQFMDKTTLGSASILGIDYLLFEFPQNLGLQRFPVGKWISVNIFVWGITLACTSACNSFASLFVTRFILGMCEGSVTAGFMIVTSMFYTRNEQTLRVGYWCKRASFSDIGFKLITPAVTMSGTDGRAYVGAVYFIPPLVGVLMIEFLPWSNQIGLLFGIWLVDIGITGFVLSVSWLTTVTAGHTKRVTTNAIMLSAYCVGNALGPFMWQTQYKPRNYIPWIVIGICYILCPLLLLTIRFVLNRENKKRDAEPVNDDFEVYIEQVTADGKHVEVRVDKKVPAVFVYGTQSNSF
ncbi:hypothetical protein M405DRAFT_889850 [Rhizopogon salebrosus TDB-379]|nr:hypothetical protein M405DRAFT_889850 [Rhizopogon salebrosus TDB-379]